MKRSGCCTTRGQNFEPIGTGIPVLSLTGYWTLAKIFNIFVLHFHSPFECFNELILVKCKLHNVWHESVANCDFSPLLACSFLLLCHSSLFPSLTKMQMKEDLQTGLEKLILTFAYSFILEIYLISHLVKVRKHIFLL